MPKKKARFPKSNFFLKIKRKAEISHNNFTKNRKKKRAKPERFGGEISFEIFEELCYNTIVFGFVRLLRICSINKTYRRRAIGLYLYNMD
jgi:hypothetical protein